MFVQNKVHVDIMICDQWKKSKDPDLEEEKWRVAARTATASIMRMMENLIQG